MDKYIEKFIDLMDDEICEATINPTWGYWTVRFPNHPEISLILDEESTILAGSLVYYGTIEELVKKLKDEYFL